MESIKAELSFEPDQLLYANFTSFTLAAIQAERPHVWMQYLKKFLHLVSTKDPFWFHFDIARKVLEKNGCSTDQDNKFLDLLARKFLETCCDLKNKMIHPENITNMFGEELNENHTNFAGLELICIDDDGECDQEFLKNGLFIWDRIYLEVLGETGTEGKKIAKWLEEEEEQLPNYYKTYFEGENKEAIKMFWFQTEDKSTEPFHSRAFLILCNTIWIDQIKPSWEKQLKYVPAITKAVLVTTIKPPLSKNCRIEVSEENKITCYSEQGRPVAIVPCVDKKFVNLICKGLGAFSSLTGHKLFRWQVRTGFENWADLVEDIRLISTTGGYEGIANLIGCGGSKKSPTEVKSILYAQAHGQFQYPQGGSGNMIILREMDKLRNGEPTKINIILGEMLLPNFTHMLPHGEKRRLVPITDLPPLIGSKNTYAAQAMLQLLILEEFSNHSDDLFERRSIPITVNKWEELAQEAKLPKSALLRVISGWIEGDLFTKPFLDKQGTEYTLGSTYSNVTNFLERQGEQRIVGAKGGERSVLSKKKKIEKQYIQQKS